MEKEKNWLNRFLITGFIVFSTAFLAFMYSEPHTLNWLVKTFPIACLAFFAFLNMPGKRLLGTGLVLFIISDALIAYPMFVAPIAHSSFWVMFTYYAAQALLTWGTLKMKPQR